VASLGGNGEDPTAGVKALHDLLSKHLAEIDELVIAIRHRISIEESYAFRLTEYSRALMTINLSTGFVATGGSGSVMPYGGMAGVAFAPAVSMDDHQQSNSSSPTTTSQNLSTSADDSSSSGSNSRSSTPVPAADSVAALVAERPGGGSTLHDESSLLPVARNWGRLIHEMVVSSKRHSDTLLLASLTPLQAFVLQHRRMMERKKAEVDTNYKAVLKHQGDIQSKKAAYVTKSQNAEKLKASEKVDADGAEAPAPDSPYSRAKREADLARHEYQQAITAAEHARSALEFHITDFLMWAQETELYRLKVAKEAFLALESSQLFSLESQTRLWTVDSDPEALLNGSVSTGSTVSTEDAGSLTRLQTPSPARGVENIAMRLRTGSRRFPPFVFEMHHEKQTQKPGEVSMDSGDLWDDDGSLIPRQAFGIALEDLAKATQDPIPPIVRKCVAVLYDSQHKNRLHSGIDAWIRPNPDLPSVHFMRLEFNASLGGNKVSSTRLMREPPAVVAGVLKLFLLETPTSLCNHEVYDVLKIVYDASGECTHIYIYCLNVPSFLSEDVLMVRCFIFILLRLYVRFRRFRVKGSADEICRLSFNDFEPGAL
jgi:hypothetical protein